MTLDDEPVIHAIVLKVTPAELQQVRRFLAESGITVIYRATSLTPLYISKFKHDD